MKTLIMVLVLSSTAFGDVCNDRYTDLRKIVTKMGWRVTAEMGGPHNARSKHFRGKAIDVSVRNRTEFHVAVLTEVLTKWGYYVFDERIRPKGQKVWTGPHLHISIPDCE